MPDYPNPYSPAGSPLGKQDSLPLLFQPFSIRDVAFHNRIWVSPMCQYSAKDGHMNDYHFAHLSSMMLRGPSLTIIEATAVSPDARISPLDCGLWDDSHIAPLARLVDFTHAQRQKIGLQLAHAGRKASTRAPWQIGRGLRSEVASAADGGWPDRVLGPGDETWGTGHARPSAMSLDEVARVPRDFAAAARRAVRAGVDVLEIHAAHGYLLSSFLSPTSNSRTDRFGGSLDNRCRLALDVVRAVRAVIPAGMPLLFRISVTEWLAEVAGPSWDVEQTIYLGEQLGRAGIDLLVISSGGNAERQRVPSTYDYQTALAAKVRAGLRERGCALRVGLVGRIVQPKQAQGLLSGEGAEAAGDVALLGRQFLKEPGWVLRAAHELGVKVQWPLQYQLGRYGLETKL